MKPADKNLLTMLKRDDERAFRQIYDRYKYSCYATAFRYTKSEKLTEDMLTKLFSALWHRRREIDDLREFLLTEMITLVKTHLHHVAEEDSARKVANAEKSETREDETE